MCAGLLLWMAVAPLFSAECRTCHPRQTAQWEASGMGRSFRPAAAIQANARFRHAPSNSWLTVRGPLHSVETPSGSEEHTVDYIVGSGKAGSSFLRLNGEWLVQSPLSFYARGKHWDVSPGYERDKALTFDRPVPEECVFCHAGEAHLVPGSVNRYTNPPAPVTGIPCVRCHGDPAAHQAAPAPGNIVNPARLGGALRDAVCEQCHLLGEARILNPGKHWRDYLPGTPIEDTYTTYVAAALDAGQPLDVVSHVEQLPLSRCAQASSGKLWCGSCHQVHGGNQRIDRVCQSCHAAPARHENRASGCARCHMPQRSASDGGHSSFTDHRIQRRPALPKALSAPTAIRPWRPSAYDSRNLGLAAVHAGDRRGVPALVQTGFALLAEQQAARDPHVLAALGYVLLQKNRPVEAAALLRQALDREPRRSLWRLQYALALAAAGRIGEARGAVNQLQKDDPGAPGLRQAVRALALVPRNY